ncbi:hypothetical protein [Microtetraspora fusca]|uniref:hypothetical protein n=1 Tax=Microtetraspora fusca TaxID=1997 RepID=UPI000829F223|nr:hypothetical protein [Microtetraspora fusca]
MAGSVLVTLGILSMSCLTSATAWTWSGAAFALLGGGFATVMVTATGTVVGDAPPGYAGVVGGLKQTAMNIGPTLGIAVAAGLMQAEAFAAASSPPLKALAGTAHTAQPALLALAAVAALGLLPGLLLPAQPTPNARHPDETVATSPSRAAET